MIPWDYVFISLFTADHYNHHFDEPLTQQVNEYIPSEHLWTAITFKQFDILEIHQNTYEM